MNCVLPSGLMAMCLVGVGHSAFAQSLSQQLKAESPAALAKAARERGNAVRGAILFPQQKLGCTNCHGPDNQKLLGPDLTRLGSEATDVSLVEALLEPSKLIRKGFETVSIVTDVGKQVSGRIVEQSPEQLVLRDSSAERRLVTLERSEIAEIRQNKTSGMPDKLIDQLKDRQQFLDLVRYMIEIATAGPTAAARHTHLEGGGTISEELQGLVLLKNFNCSACHRDDSSKSLISVRRAPILSWSGGRINPHYIERFIADPLRVKPGTTMPDVMTAASTDERREAAEEITHYLVSLSDRSFTIQALDREAAAAGRELFHSVGCVACHSPRNDAGLEVLPDRSVPLGILEHKYNLDGLVSFLKNPHEVRPAGRMPNMRLTHWEAIDIAHYLLSRSSSVRDSRFDEVPSRKQSGPPTNRPRRPGPLQESFENLKPFSLNSSLAASGRTQFQRLGCGQCHGKVSHPTSLKHLDRSSVPGPRVVHTDPKRSPEKPLVAALPLKRARLDRGCLSDESGPWPRFSLRESQRKAIRSALARESRKLTDRQQVALTLTAFRCVNCHQRDELGGVSAERNPHFQTTNPNLGPQGRIPPTLTAVGAKLQPKWMRQVLVSGRSIRPYIKTRMPQYGTENVIHLVDLFQRVDQLPEARFAKFSDQKQMRTSGLEMAGTGGLNCIACHTFQLKRAATMPAVDLTELAERLHKNWFYHYMRDPQRLSMNTVMPSFWPGGQSIRKNILDGDTEQQIEALWQYLLDGRQARPPRGLIREPLKLLATDEAVMLRRSYRGIGKRGIGVGYPNQVNLAFDAEQMRLAMIWKGRFADPGGVWRGQGHGTVRPLGSHLIRFVQGPELDDALAPWAVDEGRPPQHRFRGYSLDDKQRPKFLYQFGDIDVEDYAIDVIDQQSNKPFIRRTLTLRSDQEVQNLVFRAAGGKSIVLEGHGTFLIDKSLRIRIDENHTGRIVDTASGKQLRVPLDGVSRTATLVLDYVW